MVTPIALHSVAHRVPHQIPAESEMSRQNRTTPPPNQGVAPFSGPPVAPSSHSQQAGGQAGGCRGGLVEHRGTFGFRTQIAPQGGVAATVAPVALVTHSTSICDSTVRVKIISGSLVILEN